MRSAFKSWQAWCPLLLVMASLLIAAFLYLPSGSRVTRANCERIKEGMTEGEVRAILGKPWDDSLLDPEGPSHRAMHSFAWALTSYRLSNWVVEPRDQIAKYSHWVGSDLVLFVAFRNNGRVARALLISDFDRPQTSLAGRAWRRLRKRLGW